MLLNKEDSLLLLIDVQEKLIPFIFNKEALIKRCEWLLRLAHVIQVPVLVSEQYPKGLGHTMPLLTQHISHNERIEKVTFSCMQEPKFVHKLGEYRKSQLILCGMEAHVCVLQTALELKREGFDVYIVVDAVGSRAELDLKYALKRMKQDGIHLITAEMVFFEWLRTANIPNFKELSKEFLQ